MKRLTQEEFTAHLEREAAVMRSRGIFIASGITNNISVAFELYQSILAETERPLAISMSYEKTSLSVFDTLPRVPCPVCDAPMYIRTVPPNDEGIITQLVCSSELCQEVLDTEQTVEQWVEILKEEDARLKETNKGTEN